jgi:hypothetical protein
MIDAIVRGSLGKLGSIILDFYINNAFLINGLILIYAIALVLANQARKKIEDGIKEYFTDNFGQDLSKKSESWFAKNLERKSLDWEHLSELTWMPFISPKKSFGFKSKSTKSLSEIFTPEYIKKLFSAEE